MSADTIRWHWYISNREDRRPEKRDLPPCFEKALWKYDGDKMVERTVSFKHGVWKKHITQSWVCKSLNKAGLCMCARLTEIEVIIVELTHPGMWLQACIHVYRPVCPQWDRIFWVYATANICSIYRKEWSDTSVPTFTLKRKRLEESSGIIYSGFYRVCATQPGGCWETTAGVSRQGGISPENVTWRRT